MYFSNMPEFVSYNSSLLFRNKYERNSDAYYVHYTLENA